MKVLVLTNSDAGLYKFRRELLQEMLHQKCRVYVSLPGGEFRPALEEMGCECIETPVDRRGKNPFSEVKLLRQYDGLMNVIRPELVITYTIKPNVYGGIVCRFRKIPYAVNITGLGTAFQRDCILKAMIIRLYRLACKRAKVVFFENRENRQVFIDNRIVEMERTCLLPGAGVNLEEFAFCEYPPDDGTVRFLFIGRLMKEKGVDELFEAAERVKARCPLAVFDVVGPFEDSYQAVVEKLQQRGVIRYHGYQKDVRPLIRDAHCFVLPSYHEGMANTLLECGAMGRPLITSRIHGCMEAVISEASGFLCEAKSSESVYQAICRFIDLPYDQKSAMGKKSREYIENTFGKGDVVMQTMQALFEEGGQGVGRLSRPWSSGVRQG